jgi:hypothetical protein
MKKFIKDFYEETLVNGSISDPYILCGLFVVDSHVDLIKQCDG